MRFLPSLSLSPSLPPGPDDGAAAAAAINRLLTPSFPQSSLCVPLTKSRKTKELSSIILHRLKSCGMKLHTAGTRLTRNVEEELPLIWNLVRCSFFSDCIYDSGQDCRSHTQSMPLSLLSLYSGRRRCGPNCSNCKIIPSNSIYPEQLKGCSGSFTHSVKDDDDEECETEYAMNVSRVTLQIIA